MTDLSREIAEQVRAAASRGEPLFIQGGGSKRDAVGRLCQAPTLEVAANSGIVDYQPGELVITARAGTSLLQLQQVLAAEGQSLSFEPPLYEGRATLGGTLACNLSGPARPFAGSIRDMVLGVQLVNGRGELLNFGGQVMKNVAGYDVARLQAGALGTLGVITRVSLKVLPQPEHRLTLAYEVGATKAVELMNLRAGEAAPLTAACWFDGRLYLRLAGATSAVAQTRERWGGERLDDQDTPWQGLREMSLPFFSGDAPLWRLSVRSTAVPGDTGESMLIDWCGAQRWVRGKLKMEQLQQQAAAAGGHASLFSGGDRESEVRPPLDNVQQRLQQRLKQAFDPAGIINPGRLYSWM